MANITSCYTVTEDVAEKLSNLRRKKGIKESWVVNRAVIQFLMDEYNIDVNPKEGNVVPKPYMIKVELLKWLRWIAEDEKCDVSFIVNKALDEYIHNYYEIERNQYEK